MNTRIARRLNEAKKHTDKELDNVARDIVEAHNKSARNGFIELPSIDYRGTTYTAEGVISVCVSPKCGMANINDLWLLKEVWGASDLDVCSDSALVIILSFKY